MTHGSTTFPAPPAPATPATGQTPRWAWLAGGAGLLAACGIASAFVFRSKPAEVPEAPVAALTAPAAKTPAPAVAKPAAKPAATVATGCENASCGVVDSVKAVKVKGQGTGAGAVVGGVLGGVVGHQMGGGTGKTAMTVLGAIGGGVAGNEVEKRARAETVYQVHLRMDDGSQRTVTLKQAPVAKGDRVAVEGQNLRRVGTTQTASQ